MAKSAQACRVRKDRTRQIRQAGCHTHLRQIAAEIATSQGLSKKLAEAVLNETVARPKGVVKGQRVRFGALGIFNVKKLPARTGRNPATGEAIKIKARKKVAFRAAKELSDAL